MQWLKQSTAASVFLGPFVDDSNGYTPETGLTIAQADIRLSKNGAVFAQKNDATGASHGEFGWYNVEIDATDTGTLGRLVMAASSTGALPCWREFMVLPANTYDSLVAGTDNLDIEVATVTDAGANKIADHTLRRSSQNALDSGDGDAKTGRSLVGAVSKLTHKIEISGGTLTVYEDDDSTSLFTQTVGTDSNADPITSLDTD